MTTKIEGSTGIEFPDSTQQSTAALLLSAFTGSNQSKTSNGYQKLPGGLIIQWLTVPGAASDNPFNFPIPFPTALLCAVATPFALQPGGGVALAVSFGTLTNAGGTVQPRYIDAAQVIASSAPIKVIALGY